MWFFCFVGASLNAGTGNITSTMPHCVCNKIKIYYEIHGEGVPLLFINGLGSDIVNKKAIIDGLGRHVKLIAFDMRGVGRSDRPKEPYTMSQLAGDASALVQELGFEKINIMGFSMGGCVAMQMAHDYPQVVDKLILVSTAPSLQKPYLPSQLANRLLHCTEMSVDILREVYNLLYSSEWKSRNNFDEYVKERLNHPYPQPLHGYLNQLRALDNFDLCDGVRQIENKTLVITGDSDLLIPPQNSYWLNEQIAGSRLIVYKGISHMPVDEVPEKLADDVANFLEL